MKEARGWAFYTPKERNVEYQGRQTRSEPHVLAGRRGAEFEEAESFVECGSGKAGRTGSMTTMFVKRLLPRAGEVLIALHNSWAHYSMNDEVGVSDSVAAR